jgi:ketosteroid isomerase-like protein
MSTTDTSTLSSVDRLLAIEDIKAVCHRYALGLDSFDMDVILSAYSEDAVFDASPFGLGRLVGHAEIRAFFQHNLDVMKSQMHLYANFIIDLQDADNATGTNYLFEEGYNNDGKLIRCLGRDDDRYVRTADGWKIAERVIHPLVEPQLEGYVEST